MVAEQTLADAKEEYNILLTESRDADFVADFALTHGPELVSVYYNYLQWHLDARTLRTNHIIYSFINTCFVSIKAYQG